MSKKKSPEEEERYVITPKGIAALDMLQCGLISTMDDPRVEGFWTLFERDMGRSGYIEEAGHEA